ncbi:MAG: hypothetical protein V1644_03875 [Candidatus Micrarchaeota archaeon]
MFFPQQKMLALPSTPIFFDVGGVGVSFISHAHGDHAVKSALKVICSSETFELAKQRGYVKKSARIINAVEGANITLLDAGHVFGSKQLLIENGSRFLYTGDLCLSPSLTSGVAQVTECDELLIECTFGSPRFKVPSRLELGQQMAQWTVKNEKQNAISIIGGYSLGKAQEIIAHLNEAGVTPLVPKVIEEVSTCYNSLGHKLKFISLETQEGQEQLNRSFTAVMPLSKVNLELGYALTQGYGRSVKLAVCSGWTVEYVKPGITGFALSDHADFNELTQFVQDTEAKKVYCTYGFEEEFARSLQRKGIDAVSLKKVSKKDNQQLL